MDPRFRNKRTCPERVDVVSELVGGIVEKRWLETTPVVITSQGVVRQDPTVPHPNTKPESNGKENFVVGLSFDGDELGYVPLTF